MSIDPGFPVYLKRSVLDPLTGNNYPALPNRPYQPGELPRRFLTDQYCSQEGIVVVSTETVRDLRMLNTAQGAQPPVQLRPDVIETRSMTSPMAVQPSPPVIPAPGIVPHPPTFVEVQPSPAAVTQTTETLSPSTTTTPVVEQTGVEALAAAVGETPVPITDATVAVGEATTAPALPTLQINLATEEAIATALNGVGVKTAEKVVKARSVGGPFESLDALDARAPLPFGHKWEEFKSQLVFS